MGKILRELRRAAKHTYMTAAVECGVSINTWVRWEKGLSPVPADRLADAGRTVKADLAQAFNPYICAAA